MIGTDENGIPTFSAYLSCIMIYSKEPGDRSSGWQLLRMQRQSVRTHTFNPHNACSDQDKTFPARDNIIFNCLKWSR